MFYTPLIRNTNYSPPFMGGAGGGSLPNKSGTTIGDTALVCC